MCGQLRRERQRRDQRKWLHSLCLRFLICKMGTVMSILHKMMYVNAWYTGDVHSASVPSLPQTRPLADSEPSSWTNVLECPNSVRHQGPHPAKEKPSGCSQLWARVLFSSHHNIPNAFNHCPEKQPGSLGTRLSSKRHSQPRSQLFQTT